MGGGALIIQCGGGTEGPSKEEKLRQGQRGGPLMKLFSTERAY